jgi:predicted RNA binding protein YcfA (HicA-like mRNA interferase family)
VPGLPPINGAECVAALERLGFASVRQCGSHVVMRRGDRGCLVPLHRQLKPGTLHGVLKQAGVDLDGFTEALGGR